MSGAREKRIAVGRRREEKCRTGRTGRTSRTSRTLHRDPLKSAWCLARIRVRVRTMGSLKRSLHVMMAHQLWKIVGALALALPWVAPGQKVPVVEKTLANGMRMLLVERHDEPAVAGGWVAHVGSSNEKPGMTGIAHLFEHMMFKGTPTIGTTDYSKDVAIISGQERIRDEMRQEERKMRAGYRHGDIDDVLKPENKT